MEDHHQYGGMDPRQYIAGRPFFPAVSRPPDFLSNHRGLISPYSYDMLMFGSEPNNNIVTTGLNNNSTGGGESSSGAAAGGGFSGLFEMDAGGVFGGGDGGGTARWPRQETLTLLEIRSKLDSKFKEANQKGPLWDEVARIMSEEHGYQRSGKKCREKFENLYKYYKKTKDGKAGKRQGKHYRFFRQLEALYGDHQTSNNNNNNNNNNSASASETHSVGASFQYNNYPNYNTSLPNNNNDNNNQEAYLVPKLSETSLISISNNSSEYSNASSSDESDTNDDPKKKKKRKGKIGNYLKEKIKESIKAQMKKLMEKQEAWMEKMMNTIEHKDQERIMREEQWRKQDAERIEREHKFWAGERAWMESRDAALMDAFKKLTGKEKTRAVSHLSDDVIWPESEVTRLIQLRNEMEVRFQQVGGGNVVSEEVMWEEIATKMVCFGYERRSAAMCRDKWDSVNDYLIKCNKKRRDNIANAKGPSSCTYYQNLLDSNICNSQGLMAYSCEQGIENTVRVNDEGENSQSNGNAVNDSCFRYFIGDAYGRSI